MGSREQSDKDEVTKRETAGEVGSLLLRGGRAAHIYAALGLRLVSLSAGG